jgi:membrane protease YdiL (CAAX protease family)
MFRAAYLPACAVPLRKFQILLMRYWRHYPRFLQTILLLLMVCTLVSFSYAISGILIAKLYGVTITPATVIDVNSPDKLIHALRLVQVMGSLFTYLGAALLFAYLTHPKPYAYLGFHRVRDSRQLLIVSVLMIACIPVLLQIGAWMHLIPMGAEAAAAQARSAAMEAALMKGTSAQDLLFQLLAMALLPALGEEMLFRGIFMRFSYGINRNIHFAVLFSAALFAMIHMKIYSFPSLMLAGVLLGYIYYYTGSLWLSILAHFLNNGVQITIAFLAKRGDLPASWSTMESFPLLVIAACVALVVAAFWWLRKKATPLPPDWNNDFADA